MIQAAVDGFRGTREALSSGYWGLQPSEICSGGPVQDQFTRNDVRQLAVEGPATPLRSQAESQARRSASWAAIAPDGHRGEKSPGSVWRPLDQSSGNLTKRAIGTIPRDISSRSARVRARRRAPPGAWSNSSARQQQTANGSMWLAIGAPDLMQRLSRLPPVPNVTLFDRRKPKSLSGSHANTTFTQRLTSDGVASTCRMHRA